MSLYALTQAFNPISTRTLFAIGSVFCLCMLSAAYVAEYSFHLEPCTLCILQRWVLWSIAILYILATLHHPRRLAKQIYSFLLIVLNLFGSLIAMRHLWLQYFIAPHNFRPCSADLKTLLQFKPWMQVLSDLLIRTQDCAMIQRLFGIPLSLWSLISFLAVGTLSTCILIRALKK
jgi:disulfide bond formation protein DsbB